MDTRITTLICYVWVMLFAIPQMMAQHPEKRSLQTLIDTDDPAWPDVKKWIAGASNRVEVLPVDSNRAKSELYAVQVTLRSPMGAVVYHTGGILVDGGWLRILGSGSEKLPRGMAKWNDGKTFDAENPVPGYLLVADDVLGGLFAINGGALSEEHIGDVFYFAPETLEWESLDIGYTGFLDFCFNGDVALFYEGFRWPGWEKDVAALKGDEAIHCYPHLFSQEGQDITKVSRSVVPIQELWERNR